MTTQDPNIQKILDEEYANPENYPANTQYALDYALTVTDPDGNEVNYSKEMLKLFFRMKIRNLTFCSAPKKRDRLMWTVIKKVFFLMEARLLQNV